MKNFILTLVFISSTVLLTNCSDDDLGSGKANLKVTAGISSITSNRMAVAKNSASNLNDKLKFTSGYIWVREVQFDGDFLNGGTVSSSIERFSKIDFATGVATPSIDDLFVPAGTYKYAELEIELRDEDSQPAILLEGTYTHSNGTVYPIRFEFNSGETFEMESDDTTIVINEDTTVISKIVFDPQVWFSVVPVSMLDNATRTAGVIIISSKSNEAIFDLVADRLDESTETEFK